MSDNKKITIVIELDPDNAELEKTTSVQINTLLRYGKILESLMKKSMAYIQSMDISDKVNGNITNKMNDVQTILINNINNGLNTKVESLQSQMSEKLTCFNYQVVDIVKSNVKEVTTVLTGAENIIKKIQYLYENNNNIIDKTNNQMNDLNRSVSKELTDLRSHFNGVMEKYNTKNILEYVQKTISCEIENLALTIKNTLNMDSINMLINSNNKDIQSQFSIFGKDLQSQINVLGVEMKHIAEKINIDNIVSLIKTIIGSSFTELKLNIENAKNIDIQISKQTEKQLDMLRNDLKELSQRGDESKTYIDNKLTSIGSELKTAMYKTSTIGIIGENKVKNLLDEKLNGYDIIDTSKIKNQFDIQITNTKYNICIECKNHNKNVSVDDMKRFMVNVRDSMCDAIINVNHEYGFPDIKHDFVFFKDYYGKPVIFISKLSKYPQTILIAIEFLEAVIDFQRKQKEFKENDITGGLNKKINEQTELIGKMRKSRAQAVENLNAMLINIQMQINSVKSTISLLNTE